MDRIEGIGRTLGEAADKAVEQLPARPGRDYRVGRVVEWGLQRGGFIDAPVYYVAIEEDPNAPFRTVTGDDTGPQ